MHCRLSMGGDTILSYKNCHCKGLTLQMCVNMFSLWSEYMLLKVLFLPAFNIWMFVFLLYLVGDHVI